MLFAARNRLPTHLLIGVRKGATSWIWKQTTDHPDVFAHPRKELYFFNKHYQRGLEWYRNQFQTSLDVVFEATPDYFYKGLSERIKRDLPDSKLLVCLRNPMDRAYSHWKFGKYVKTCGVDFQSAWDADWNRVRTRGLYDEHLESFLEQYSLGENLLVLLYDDLESDPLSFVNQVYDYLGVERRESRFFDKKWMPGEVSATGKEDVYKPISDRQLPDQEYDALRDYYTESIENTEKILGRSLAWLDS